MIQIKFLSAKKMSVILTLVLSTFLVAQPLSKVNYNLSIKEKTKQTLIPFNYANYKKVGPLSKNVFVPIRQTENISSLTTEHSFFLKQKRHSTFTIVNESNMSKNSVKSFFIEQKRHQ